MNRPIPGKRSNRIGMAKPMLVWRITEAAPMGEWVDPSTDRAAIAPASSDDPTSSTWAMSSFDLQHGADVSEEPDTVPAELFDELFSRKDI